MEPNRREFIKQCAFQKFCNTVLHNEACDAHKELHRHKAREITFSDLTLEEARQLHTFDEYFKGEIAFERAGKKITPKLLLEAIRTLPEEKRKAVLLYYFEGMNDTEILVGVLWWCYEMVIVFRAFHIYIWVAFVGFFLPLVVAFTSRNAARFSFLETQDCIRHRRIPPFFRRVTVLWGDSGDGGDSSFGIPPADCRNCHPHPLHDGHVDDDGVFGIPPSQEPSPSCRHSFIRSRKA